jgi:hypothetical protein
MSSPASSRPTCRPASASAVTSKIDSRTILGEQGAEQLLGKGDMLYMPGGKQIRRVHGPFVSATRKCARWPITGARRAARLYRFGHRGAGRGQLRLRRRRSPARTVRKTQVPQGLPAGVRKPEGLDASWIQRQMGVGYNSAAKCCATDRSGWSGAAKDGATLSTLGSAPTKSQKSAELARGRCARGRGRSASTGWWRSRRRSTSTG